MAVDKEEAIRILTEVAGKVWLLREYTPPPEMPKDYTSPIAWRKAIATEVREDLRRIARFILEK